MKKLILFYSTLFLFSLNCLSQDELLFKVQYKPETNYTHSTERNIQVNIKYSGSETILQKLKDKGIQNPTVTNTQSKIESSFKTGKLIDSTTFPLIIEFTKITSSDGKNAIPDGIRILGHCSNGSKLSLDSIITDQLDNDSKKSFLQSMQALYSQIPFPEKKIKVGESFSMETPFSIPIAGVTLEMAITTNYKLVSILTEIGRFDVTQTYTLKTTSTKFNITATGTGKGTLLYDVLNNNYLRYQVDMEMLANIKFDDLDFNLTLKSGSINTTGITPN